MVSMFGRTVLAVTLLLALFAGPLRAGGPACGMSMPAAQKMACMACCAKMKSCALPRQNPTQSATAPTVHQQAIALLAPALPVLLSALPASPVAAPRHMTQSLAHSPPRLALFCSFLI